MSEDTNRAVRTAQNESLFREVNERVNELNKAFEPLSRDAEWVCECGNTGCLGLIRMTHEEYEAVRARGRDCFLIKPDEAHVVPEAEKVVERHERYWVVQKISVAAEIAEEDATSSG